MKNFWQEREKEESALQQQVDQEWEGRIKELTEKFDSDMAKKGKKDKKVGLMQTWLMKQESTSRSDIDTDLGK